MAKTATQRTTGNTRFKGPVLVTLYGGGSKGHDGQTVGAGFDVGLSVQIPSAQSANSFQIEKPDGTVITAFDSNGNLSQLGGSSGLTTQISGPIALTAANINGMYAAPVQILAAPGSGLSIVVQYILFEITTTSTQFAAGGVVLFQYDSTANGAGTAVHSGTIPAAVITATAGTTVTGLWAASGSNGLTIPANKGIFISNQTQAFTTGTGTAKVWISYGILTR